MIAPTIHTARYYASHLKEPRGAGLWLFETSDKRVVVEHNGAYRDARQAALAWARRNQVHALYTCP